MNNYLKIHPRLAYGIFWVWGILSVYVFAQFYKDIANVANIALETLIFSVLDDLEEQVDSMVLFDKYIGLGGIVYTLFWWRVVKVFVLLGSPVSFGMKIVHGTRMGRNITHVHIGTTKKKEQRDVLYGAIFRAHPNSDKLMRHRLEFLLLTLPVNRCLVVQESRILCPTLTPSERTSRYINATKTIEK